MPNNKETLNKAIKLYGLEGIHPAAEIVPMMEAEQYIALVEDVRANGFLNPVKVTKDNLVIDGRNRLCASIDAFLDVPIEEYNPADPVQYIVSENVRRRHLTVGQRAMIGTSIEEYYAADAKRRQGVKVDLPTNPNIEENSPHGEIGRSAEKAGKAVNVSDKSIKQAKAIKQSAPDLAEEVQQGRSLHSAYKETKEREQSRPIEPKPKPTNKTIYLLDHKGNEVPYPEPKGKATFNRTNNAVQWAWWTWNPVTGCLHGCEYCYAREMALSPTFRATYPVGFTPLFRHDRLSAPVNTTVPSDNSPEAKRVFVCSMADLFGEWVPGEWIQKVIAATKAAPGFEYLFLTKNPKRYLQVDMPNTAWAGATIDRQSKAQEIIGELRKVKRAGVRWVSFEPLHEPISADFSGIDWVVVGARSGTSQQGKRVPGFAPNFEWVMSIVEQARKANCSIYLKANLLGQTSDQWPGMKLIQETPKRKEA